jgi:hypothetical protein
MRISYLLAAVFALGMVPGRTAANQGDSQSAGAVDCSQCQCGQGATGGSGDIECTPCECQPSTGGVGGAGAAMGAQGDETNVTVITGEPREEEKSANQGLSVALQGGVAGFTSTLAPRIEPGGGWGLLVAAQPTPIVGLELSYLGASNYIDDPLAGGSSRLIRTAGQADVKFSLLPRAVEPYLFGGIGLNRATIRNNNSTTASAGYQPDTFGSVPVGGGINFHAGRLLVGARGTYDWLFSQSFAPRSSDGKLGITGAPFGDIWRAELNLGGTF